MTRTNALWSFVVLAFVAIVLVWRFAINRSLTADVTSSVSGQVSSIMLCDLISNQISTRCVSLEKEEKERAINAVRLGSAAATPSHGSRKSEYLLKIMNSTTNDNVSTKCFVLVEYVSFERDLYLLPIRAGEDCSSDTFKYAPGSIRVRNFLHPAKQ
jgi:hypothetical protein